MEWSAPTGTFAGRQQKWPPVSDAGDAAGTSMTGDESVLSSLWERFESSIDKAERRRLFHVFLKKFLDVYTMWEPSDSGEALETTLFTVFSAENALPFGDVVVGSSAGHPTEFILALIKDVIYLTSLISEFNFGAIESTSDPIFASMSMALALEGQPVLDALAVIVRSVHNCRVFGHYGGVQKLISLIKVTAVQLKTISSVVSSEEQATNSNLEKLRLLEGLLVHVVSIICCFIDLNSSAFEVSQMYGKSSSYFPKRSISVMGSSSCKGHVSERVVKWKQRAVLLFMEAGGLNWFVELMRVNRRFGVELLSSTTLLQYLILRVLHSTLSENPRGQNHFRSIGGLEVLMDVLALPSSTDLESKSRLVGVLESFGNLSCLQFISENGRVHKFANSFCSAAFMLHGCNEEEVNLMLQLDTSMPDSGLEAFINAKSPNSEFCDLVSRFSFFIKSWRDYAVTLSRVLSLFILSPEEERPSIVDGSSGRKALLVSTAYRELSMRWFLKVLLSVFHCIKACLGQDDLPAYLWLFVSTLRNHAVAALRKVVSSSPSLVVVCQEEGVWELLFSDSFYFRQTSPHIPESCEGRSLQMEVISLVVLAATSSVNASNYPECSALLNAVEQSACNLEVAASLAKSLLHVLQISPEKTVTSFIELDAASRLLKVACMQAQQWISLSDASSLADSISMEVVRAEAQSSDISKTLIIWDECLKAIVELFSRYLSTSVDVKVFILHSTSCINCLFELFWLHGLRGMVLGCILDIMKTTSTSEVDLNAKVQLCSKYLETFTRAKEKEKEFANISIDLLYGIREILSINQPYHQALFRDAGCLLHVVSLLNGSSLEANGENLALSVLETLTCLLAGNDVSKAAFRDLVGVGYQSLKSLLLDYSRGQLSERLLNALLDMLVDGKFDIKGSPLIESTDSLKQSGLNIFLQLLRDCISNRDSCVRARMLSFLLDWFPEEDNPNGMFEIAQLIQVTGGHSISGKDIRKIFALLRGEKVGKLQQYFSLLLNSVLAMLNEKGPVAFFDLIGNDSGVSIRSPVQWPLNKGFTFSCWLRVENFPRLGTMGLFIFLTDNGKGSVVHLAKGRLIYECINQKQQCLSLQVNLVRRRWHFLCVTHNSGKAFSGGSLFRCYVDGALVSSEKCRYARVNELSTYCAIGAKIPESLIRKDKALHSVNDVSPFSGQIGPVYVFSDAITPEQVLGIYSLGPSYMYSFFDNGVTISPDDPTAGGFFNGKDDLASKMIIGLNAQAHQGRELYNVAPLLQNALDKHFFEAAILPGTQLCSRRLLKEIIYCVGGISVFFPLFTQCYLPGLDNPTDGSHDLIIPFTKERLTAEIIELIASVLDDNLSNQQQMLQVSGFSILGFLMQSIPLDQLNLETLSALKHLFNVIADCGLSELLVKDAISCIFVNPFIWVRTVYEVQRELYMFLIQQFDNDPRLLQSMCRLPRVLDFISNDYSDGANIGSSSTKEVKGERLSIEEVRKLRLLLLSLGEMSIRQSIDVSDIRALVAFLERCHDMMCIEDVLHMVIRAISQKPLLASFVEQVNLIGGCHVFIDLLQRDYEPVRLLSLQLVGRLLVGVPSEKKGAKFFYLAIGRSRSPLEGNKKGSSRTQQIVSAISDRLLRFPLTDNLSATFFDVLLGGASPKQVLQKQNQFEQQRSKGNSSHFVLPQILALICKFLSKCQNAGARIKILSDLLELLDSSPSNIEALMEYGWNAWLEASIKLDVVMNHRLELIKEDDSKMDEQNHLRSLFSLGGMSYNYALHYIYADLITKLIELSSMEYIFLSQPCRDNTLYILKLVDELLLTETDYKLSFPGSGSDLSDDFLQFEDFKAIGSAADEVSGRSNNSDEPPNKPNTPEDVITDEGWWNLYDNIWILISQLNGNGPSKTLSKTASTSGSSFGQRARGFVESLNIPAAEMAAAVVTAGFGNALGGKPSKTIDKAMLLMGGKCPRIVLHLVALYLCRASLERASQFVQQLILLIPTLLISDDEPSKNRLLMSLLALRRQYGVLDDGMRFHVISQLINATVSCGQSVLASSIVGRDLPDGNIGQNEVDAMHNLLQMDRILLAVSDEASYVKSLKADRVKQLHDFSIRMDDSISIDCSQKDAFEADVANSLSAILASDDSRRVACQLAYDEEQQIAAENWLHVFRFLIDERGPWSANPYPNRTIRHWKLDKTEDSWRRRHKLRQNYHFDESLCQPPTSSSVKDRVTLGSQGDSDSGVLFPGQMKHYLLKGIRRIADIGSSEALDPEPGSSDTMNAEDVPDFRSSELDKDNAFAKEPIQERKDAPSLVTERERSEVLASVPCVLVATKRKQAGNLAIKKNVLHFYSEVLVEGAAASALFKDFVSLKNSESVQHDDTASTKRQKYLKLPMNLTPDDEDSIDRMNKNVKRHRRWNVSKIKSVYWTRYLLRYTAIEIFFSDSAAPVLINFSSRKVAKDIGNLIVATRNESFQKGSSRDRGGVISLIDRHVAQNMAETARERWKRREITNFEYLMTLNTLAGRSYNDLTQYPVFPWIVADYSSETLDFNKSSTFRDLSKPVGALDSKRFEVFEDRYQNFSDPDIPRLEPFTALHRNFQGGKFDNADRLFESIGQTYRNCLSNTSDVKELIPEFFYMPEFLVNSNSYHLGIKQDGEPIGDVLLPPWAMGSAEEFINRNREALESEYVSSNLHHWIDLIFGYKQRGKPAVEAANIFYYLTYEGAVDLDCIEDELQQSAMADQIANFGQTPIQLFRKKHPRRGPPIPIAHPLRFAPASIGLTSILSSTSSHPSMLLYVGLVDSNIVLVNQGRTISVKLWLTSQLQSGGNFTFSGSQDHFFGIGSDILSPHKTGSPLAENIEPGAPCYATLQTPMENFLISSGNWDNSFEVISLSDGRVVQSIRQHKDVVTAVSVTSDGSIVATGSHDTTVMLWEVCQGRAHDKRARSTQNELSRRETVVSRTPLHILCGHDDSVTCLYASSELDIVISGSKDGSCVIHTLREGRYVRSLRHPSGSPLSKLVVSRHARIVMYADDDLSLHLFSINGKWIGSSDSNGRLNCVEVSACGEFVVCAGDQGQIVVRTMNSSLEIVRKYTGIGNIITSLAVTPEECFLAGTKDGSLLVYSIENTQLQKTSSSSQTAKTKAVAAPG
ncbi:BEACH domain-containing protein [Drosera capensis]